MPCSHFPAGIHGALASYSFDNTLWLLGTDNSYEGEGTPNAYWWSLTPAEQQSHMQKLVHAWQLSCWPVPAMTWRLISDWLRMATAEVQV